MSDCAYVGNLCFAAEWVIKDYCTVSELDVYSPDFWVSDAKWYICVCPTQRGSDWMSIYLFKKRCKTENHLVHFTLGIRRWKVDVFKSYSAVYEFTNHSQGQGWRFLKKSKLRRLPWVLLDGGLHVFCEIELRSSSVAYNPTDTLTHNFKDLCLSGLHSDIIVKVKDQVFPAHRSILAARSPVFAAMFEHQTVEKLSGVVEITDCDPKSFTDFLLFLYTGKIGKITEENVFSLYKTADKYDLKELMKKCVYFLAQKLSVASFSDTILLAELHNESELLKIATEFFINKSELILHTEQWQTLLKQNSTLTDELVFKLENKF